MVIVADLIYWRDPKKSGAVLASLLVLLLSLAFFSVISVFSYTALMVLFAAISFRIYKNIKQAVQKTQDGHPFNKIERLEATLFLAPCLCNDTRALDRVRVCKAYLCIVCVLVFSFNAEYLSVDVSLPADHVHSAVDVLLSQLNSTLAYLQKIFLVDDLIDTCKFGCYLWVLTYIGAWLNGLTVIILLVIALFSIPKAYEQNKSQVDQFLGNVQQQVNQVLEKYVVISINKITSLSYGCSIKAVIPIGGGGGGNKEKDQ
ncbi:hypothetical protein HAZT_HAZT000278 [Hyalella azteca]|uniref:Reticulon-like protein n=1 Tax=Hyalella azteca TaxID=294128 RepID=A0A6A0H9E9_HYAAZ|nr:hypothetical protein HAZT_HAZT000278 [Hyalella azteca]